jgi:hypothetical protein
MELFMSRPILAGIFALISTAIIFLPDRLGAEPQYLEVAAKSIIAAPRGDQLLMLIDLQAHRSKLKELPEADAMAIAVETAKHYAGQTLDSTQYRDKFASVDVILAFIESMDEYNRPDAGGMTRLGMLKLKKGDSGVDVISADVDQSLFKM